MRNVFPFAGIVAEVSNTRMVVDNNALDIEIPEMTIIVWKFTAEQLRVQLCPNHDITIVERSGLIFDLIPKPSLTYRP